MPQSGPMQSSCRPAASRFSSISSSSGTLSLKRNTWRPRRSAVRGLERRVGARARRSPRGSRRAGPGAPIRACAAGRGRSPRARAGALRAAAGPRPAPRTAAASVSASTARIRSPGRAALLSGVREAGRRQQLVVGRRAHERGRLAHAGQARGAARRRASGPSSPGRTSAGRRRGRACALRPPASSGIALAEGDERVARTARAAAWRSRRRSCGARSGGRSRC